MPRFAANLTMMFGEWAFLDRFAAAADAGFRAVECQFPYEAPADAVAARLAANGLDLVMFNVPAGDWAAGERGRAAHRDAFDSVCADVLRALDYAGATGTRMLHLMAGVGGDLASYVRALGWAAEAAAARGVDILIEPINRRDMPGYFLADFALAERLIADLACPNLRLQFDIYHRQILHGDVLTGLAALIPVIGHVQTAAVPARNEPGTGELHDARIFAHLDALGYAGHVGCEYRPAGTTLDGLGWFRNAGSGA